MIIAAADTEDDHILPSESNDPSDQFQRAINYSKYLFYNNGIPITLSLNYFLKVIKFVDEIYNKNESQTEKFHTELVKVSILRNNRAK